MEFVMKSLWDFFTQDNTKTLIEYVQHCCVKKKRKSRPSLDHHHAFGAKITRSEFKSVLLFVNRGPQCDRYLTIVQNQWHNYVNNLSSPDIDAYNKAFIVVHSGGAAGTGKTTFALKAPDNCTATMKWDPVFKETLDEYTNAHGLRLRVSFADGLSKEDLEDMSGSLALRVLHVHLKYRLKPEFAALSDFMREARKFKVKVDLRDVMRDVVCCDIANPLNRIVMLNLDEINAVLGVKRPDGVSASAFGQKRLEYIEYMKNALLQIRDCTVYHKVFVFPILTGTKAIAVEDLIQASGMHEEAIALPLLGDESVHTLCRDLYCRARRIVGNALAESDVMPIRYNLRIQLELMNGHPRFLEFLLYTLGAHADETWSAKKFIDSVDALNTDEKHTQLRTVQLEEVSKALDRYCASWFADYFQSSFMHPTTLAVLLAMSLFDRKVLRTDKVGFKGHQLLVADLEQQGLVFLTPRKQGSFKLVVPFMWLHKLYNTLAMDADLPYVCLLNSLRCVMSPADKEELIMGVLALRMLVCSSRLKNQRQLVRVEDVLGVTVKGYETILLPTEADNRVYAMDHHTLKDQKFVAGPGMAFFVNASAAPSYDGIVLSQPNITVQSKHCLTALNKLALTDGRDVPQTSYSVAIPTEIAKCQSAGSILMFVTDDRITNKPAVLPKGLALFDHDNKVDFYGEALTRRFSSCLAATMSEVAFITRVPAALGDDCNTAIRRQFSIKPVDVAESNIAAGPSSARKKRKMAMRVASIPEYISSAGTWETSAWWQGFCRSTARDLLLAVRTGDATSSWMSSVANTDDAAARPTACNGLTCGWVLDALVTGDHPAVSPTLVVCA